MKTTTLAKLLAKAGWTEESIKKVYYGRDHHCRCGCGGDYFEAGTDRFKKELDKLREEFSDDGIEIDERGFINIPDPEGDDMCWCLYNY